MFQGTKLNMEKKLDFLRKESVKRRYRPQGLLHQYENLEKVKLSDHLTKLLVLCFQLSFSVEFWFSFLKKDEY